MRSLGEAAGPGAALGAMNYLNVLAKALYDNVAESPDELSFRKGDIMTVLERNTQGLDGWWLCSLHGRQGIVPGNRLKILVGMYDKKQAGPGPGTPQQQSSLPPQTPSYNAQSASSQYAPMHPAYPSQGEDNIYLIPAQSIGQEGLYQVPQGAQSPPAKKPILYKKSTPHHTFQNKPQDVYQVPPSMNTAQEVYQVPVASTKAPQDIYQVPPSVGVVKEMEQTPPSVTAPHSIYQVPQSIEKMNREVSKLPDKGLTVYDVTSAGPWCDDLIIYHIQSQMPYFVVQ